jgi:transposase
VFSERTSVGLDVHARSVVGCGLDTVTGQVVQRRLVPTADAVLGWLGQLAAPVAVAYEAGPTGFGLARRLSVAGVRCVVVAPSKLQRPAGDRVKTDARDALHLARLLRMDQVVEVRVPGEAQEAARDLVRAREDARGDLMRCRHRLSSCCCATASSTRVGMPGPGHTRRGYAVNTSGSGGCGWPSMPSWRRCC